MNASFDTTPRPALRKAEDSDIHPTTHTSIQASRTPLFGKASTGDAVLEGKEVELTVRIPKKLRKQVRQAAKRDGASMDQFITAALAAEVNRRSR